LDRGYPPLPQAVNEEADTEVLIPREAIARRVSELGAEISLDYAGRVPVLVGILKGSVVFLSDLVRHLACEVEVDFISISSYGQSTTSSGTVRLLKDLDLDVEGRDVLVVEDIVDSGLSLAYIRKNLEARGPRSLRMAALLDKRERRTTGVRIDYIGFQVPDAFVVGYGLDYRELYRGLPHVAVLTAEDLEQESRIDVPGACGRGAGLDPQA
jgi:hypoxanthine phosphoribosyltransferase